MPRKSESQSNPKDIRRDWYLPEWMKSLRVTQASLAKECDWSPSTMHGIYHGRTAYYREIVNLLAEKLNIRPFELLMHPDEARAIQQLQQQALRVVEISQPLREVG